MIVYKSEALSYKVNNNEIIRDVNFEIKDGELAIIYSPHYESEELLKVLYFSKKPFSGKILYFGQDLSSFNHDDLTEWRINDVQFVSYEDLLFPSFSVRDNLYLPLSLNHKDLNQDYLDYLFSMMGVDSFLNEKVQDLSESERAIVKLTRALVLKPFVILVDDLSRNLDDEGRRLIMKILTKINDVFKTTIIQSTSFDDLLKMGSKRISIKNGTLFEVKL